MGVRKTSVNANSAAGSPIAWLKRLCLAGRIERRVPGCMMRAHLCCESPKKGNKDVERYALGWCVFGQGVTPRRLFLRSRLVLALLTATATADRRFHSQARLLARQNFQSATRFCCFCGGGARQDDLRCKSRRKAPTPFLSSSSTTALTSETLR